MKTKTEYAAIILILLLIVSIGLILKSDSYARKARLITDETAINNNRAHIEVVITKLQKAERGDFVVYKSGGASPRIVQVSYMRQGAVIINESWRLSLIGPSQKIAFSSKRDLVEIEDVVSKHDAQRWAPLARKFYGLD